MSDSKATQHFKDITVIKIKNFKILSNNNAVLEPVKLNDHHVLGVMDVYVKNFRRVLFKELLRAQNGSVYYLKILNVTTTCHTKH